MVIKVGDKIPSVELHEGLPPKKHNMADYVKGKKVVIVGLPGAFTPQVPAYLEAKDELKAAGVEEVIIYCVNDGAVMSAWAKDQKVDSDDFITMLGDPTSEFTKANDIEMTHEGPVGFGLLGRCKRHAMYVVDGEVKFFAIAENELDPAGDDFPEKTLPKAVLENIKKL